AEVAQREGYPYVEGLPTFRASPVDDLVLTAGTHSDPGVHAFRLSDGASVPPPPIETFPAAFLGDGQRLVTLEKERLTVVRLADGARLTTIGVGQAETNYVQLSPDDRYVLASTASTATTPAPMPIVFRSSDGARVFDLPPDFGGWSLTGFVFSPDGDRLYANR